MPMPGLTVLVVVVPIKIINHLHCTRVYKEDHDNVGVPEQYTMNPALGNWVTTQRKACKAKKE